MTNSNTPRLTPEQSQKLEKYLSNQLAPEERAEFEREILASEALCSELSLRTRLEGVQTTAAPPPVARKTVSFPRRAALALPIAAALAIAIVSPRFFRSEADDDDPGTGRRFRAGAPAPRAIVYALRGLSPTGDVAEPRLSFVWTSVPDAAYRLELLGNTGEVVFSTECADTSITISREALPADLRSVSAWWVVAREDGADVARSVPIPLHLAGRGGDQASESGITNQSKR